MLALVLACRCFCAMAEEYLTIGSLAEQTPKRWSEHFQNNLGQTIYVDCPVEVPVTDEAPGLAAAWYPALSQDFLVEFASFAAKWPMNTAYSDDASAMLTHDYHYALKESEINLKYYDEERFIQLKDIDWNAVYVRNSL